VCVCVCVCVAELSLAKDTVFKGTASVRLMCCRTEEQSRVV
jgi:hypothetical protein